MQMFWQQFKLHLEYIECDEGSIDYLCQRKKHWALILQVKWQVNKKRKKKPHRLQQHSITTNFNCFFEKKGNFSSSDGPDPSSSDLSADTVIYLGPGDDATDGEHPPVYIPSMNSGDNRCSMNKALRGSSAEKPSKLPQKKTIKRNKMNLILLTFDCFSDFFVVVRANNKVAQMFVCVFFFFLESFQPKVRYQTNELIALSVD